MRNTIKNIEYFNFSLLYNKFYQKFPYSLPQKIFPTIIDFEFTNDCNQCCKFCHRNYMKRPIGYMDTAIFIKALDEIGRHPYCFLRIGGQGEPALHPNIEYFLDYIKKKKLMRTEIVTNGLLLNSFSPDKILDWNFNIIGISVDGYDETSYKKYRLNDNYKILKNNIIHLFNRRNEKNMKYPLIKVRHIIFPDLSQETIIKYKKEWYQFCDLVSFNTYFSPEPQLQKGPYRRCLFIKYHSSLSWKGEMVKCVFQPAVDTRNVIGEISSHSIQELWLSPSSRELREIHLKREFNKLPCCKFCAPNQGQATWAQNVSKYNYERSELRSIKNKINSYIKKYIK